MLALAHMAREHVIDPPLETPLPRYRRDFRLLSDVRIAHAAQLCAPGGKPGATHPLGSIGRSRSFIDARREGGRT